MNQPVTSVDDYLRNLEPARKTALGRVRQLVLDTVPGITETMKYRMPTYELNEVVCAFASQKNYMSLYMDTGLVEQHKEALQHLNCGKSCIRFRRLDELPLETIKQILKETVQQQETG